MGLLQFLKSRLFSGAPPQEVVPQASRPQQQQVVEETTSKLKYTSPDGSSVEMSNSKKRVTLVPLNSERAFLRGVYDFLYMNAIGHGYNPDELEIHKVSSRLYLAKKPSNGAWYVYSCPLSYTKDPAKGLFPLEKTSVYDLTEIQVEWLHSFATYEECISHMSKNYVTMEGQPLRYLGTLSHERTKITKEQLTIVSLLA